jgi:2-keto-4-pentenoate hydratase
MVAKIEDAAKLIVEEHADKKKSFGVEKLSDANKVQRKVVRLFKKKHGEVARYKLALTSKPVQKLCQLSHPCSGHLF